MRIKLLRKLFSSRIKIKNEEVKLNYTFSNQEEFNPNNKTLIFLHGLFGNKNNWRGISYSKEIKEKRNTLLVDLRNHGLSDHHKSMTYSEMADDLKRLIDELNLKKVTILGHSMGGKVAMTFSCKYKDYLDGVFVVDAIPKSHNKTSDVFNNMKDIVNTASSYDLSKTSKKETLEFFNNKFGGVVANLLNTNLINNEDGKIEWRNNMIAVKDNIEKILGWENVGTYTGPVRVLNGEKSLRFSIDDLIETFPKIAIKDLRLIMGASHLIHVDKPEETIKEILKFINEIDSKL